MRPLICFVLCTAALIAAPASTRAQNAFGTPPYTPLGTSLRSAPSADSLDLWVRRLSGDQTITLQGLPMLIPHRESGSQEFLTAVGFAAEAFARFGYTVVADNLTPPYTTTNLIATKPGTQAGEILITAHLDSACPSCPGADDNASGSAAVLEAARVLRNYTFARTIRFVLFGGEELGLLGSKAYALQHASDSIFAVINLDMLLWDGNANMLMQIHAHPNAGSQRSADLAAYIAAVDTVYSLPVNTSIIPNGIGASDQAPFWTAGRSAVLLIEEFGGDFNPYYHSAMDAWATLSGAAHRTFFHAAAQIGILSAALLALPTAQVPVELAAFTADLHDRRVHLAWQTESERANAGFEIWRRSTDESEFRMIGSVPGAGSTSDARTYSFVDATAPAGMNVYRLHQIDLDGTDTWSHDADVLVPPSACILQPVSPQPVSVSARFRFELDAARSIRLRLLDMLGREVVLCASGSFPAGIHDIRFVRNDLPAGLYHLVLESAAGVQRRPVVIVR